MEYQVKISLREGAKKHGIAHEGLTEGYKVVVSLRPPIASGLSEKGSSPAKLYQNGAEYVNVYFKTACLSR